MGSALRSTTSDLLSGRMRWNPALSIMSTVYTRCVRLSRHVGRGGREGGSHKSVPGVTGVTGTRRQRGGYKDA